MRQISPQNNFKNLRPNNISLDISIIDACLFGDLTQNDFLDLSEQSQSPRGIFFPIFFLGIIYKKKYKKFIPNSTK